MTISILLKWTILVWLNAAFSFLMMFSDNPIIIDIAAVCLAVFTFVGIYACIDQYLLNRQRTQLRAELMWGVIIKSLSQFAPIIEITTGSVAISMVRDALMIDVPFLTFYLITIIDGVLLSLLVLLIMPMVRFIRFAFQKSNDPTNPPSFK